MIEQSHHELRQAFRALLHGTGCKFAASVFDPISVRMASDLGFEVAIQGGSVASLQVLGAPDISLLTLDEYAECQEFQLGQQGTPWRVLACLGVSCGFSGDAHQCNRLPRGCACSQKGKHCRHTEQCSAQLECRLIPARVKDQPANGCAR